MEYFSLVISDFDLIINFFFLDWLEFLVSEKKNINKNIDVSYIVELINCVVIYGVSIGFFVKVY